MSEDTELDIAQAIIEGKCPSCGLADGKHKEGSWTVTGEIDNIGCIREYESINLEYDNIVLSCKFLREKNLVIIGEDNEVDPDGILAHCCESDYVSLRETSKSVNRFRAEHKKVTGKVYFPWVEDDD